MWRCIVLYMVFLVLGTNGTRFQDTLGHLKPQVSDENQEKAALELIQRTIPERYGDFAVTIDGTLGDGVDTFTLQNVDGKIEIVATTGVAAATGFNFFLKYYVNSHISWEVSRIDLPDDLPQVNVTIKLNDRFRYYQNVCTSGYSFVWWSWEQWEKHIDWVAINSFNLVLAFNGQEAILDRVYRKLNLTSEDIDEHFSGPAFLPWLRMGNMRGWGGPLSEAWHERSLWLQKKIVERLRSLGVITVLPAFAGHLPRAFKELYPDVNMVKMDDWNGFNDTYCCPYFLDPTEELFNKIGVLFMKEQIAEFGTDHVYNCDSFNEVDPSTTDLTYLSNVGKSIFKALTDVDTDAIWLMQGWLFEHSFLYWSKKRAEALLTSVPKGKMIVLDLQSEQFPQYDRLEQYFGQPYIWCMLHNFGGTLGMYGSTDIINEVPIAVRNQTNSTMIGVGLTMEGINQNYAMYEFMMENAWRQEVRNKTQWFIDYTSRRYGESNEDVATAWNHLLKGLYNFNGSERIRGHYAYNRRPTFKFETWIFYRSTDIFSAWDHFISASEQFKNSPGFLHDLVDLTRQVLQVTGDIYYDKMKDYYTEKDEEGFRMASTLFLNIFEDANKILASDKAFLLGRWIKDAKDCANGTADEAQFEYNARNQITLWGPRGEILDYANKQWAGVVDDYFEPRWRMFVQYALDVFNGTLNYSYINNKMFTEVEEPFTFETKEVNTEPVGDTVQIATEIHSRWWALIKNIEAYKEPNKPTVLLVK